MKPHIKLPVPNSDNDQPYIQNRNIVIVGSNGAGKTRFGAAIERLNPSIIVHRITAQKNLSIPPSVQPTNTSDSEANFFRGNKGYGRWQNNNAITSSSNDYDKVIALLFSKSNDRDKAYTNLMRTSVAKLDVPDAPIDILNKIWNDIIPDKKLSFDSGQVKAIIPGNTFHASEMSDGERIALYLIAQCLITPDNSVLIIDEPELHLHKALVDRLWSTIEKYCTNKLLIYITHDLEFAASRQNTYKIWIKSYLGGTYNWIELPESVALPEQLLFQVLGSKKNVLFVEGESDSLDIAIYQAYYSNFLIIPMSSCHKVIEATRAIKETPFIHHIRAFGIIDRDYRPQEEVDALMLNYVYTINVAEVENLLCTEGILRLVAVQQMHNPEAIVESATNYIITALKGEIEAQISNKTENEVKFRLNNFKKRGNSKQGILDGLSATISAINIDDIYNRNEILYRDIIATRNLEQALKYYNRKTLAGRISSVFGLANKEYPELVLRLLNSDKQPQIVSALQPYLPDLIPQP
jgi:ABC-type cobalamin/Fe3+-siderophores transport system ATPase subunit